MVLSNTSHGFETLVGQPQAIQLLTRAIECDRIAPAYLFVGSHGVGRTLAARYFLNLLITVNGKLPQRRHSQNNHPDILWVEPTYIKSGKLIPISAFASNDEKRPKSRPQIRVSQIRDITRFINQTPLESSRLLVVIDAAELMGEAAANGLLKTLEEPGNASLILIASSIEALLPTIVSRCQKIPFYPLSQPQLTQVLTSLGRQDILQYPQIIALAQGSPGQAIIHWETLQSIDEELLNQCNTIPRSDRNCMALAKQIEQELDVETQLWLVDYLQQQFWYRTGNIAIVNTLEQTKTCLKQYVQPLLTWEITWLDILSLDQRSTHS